MISAAALAGKLGRSPNGVSNLLKRLQMKPAPTSGRIAFYNEKEATAAVEAHMQKRKPRTSKVPS